MNSNSELFDLSFDGISAVKMLQGHCNFQF